MDSNIVILSLRHNSPQVPYHYDVVARLKALYEAIMRPPELTEESTQSSAGPAQTVTAPSKEKATSGKKSEDGKGKKDKSVKDKKCKLSVECFNRIC